MLTDKFCLIIHRGIPCILFIYRVIYAFNPNNQLSQIQGIKMNNITVLLILFLAVQPLRVQDADITQPETFQMQWGDSTITMQQYFVVFLKASPTRNQSQEEAAQIQQQHLDYLNKVYIQGHTGITGPFGDDGEIRGIVVYNTATLEQAKRLAERDPAVKAGRLVVEVHPWWAAKGSKLR